MEHWRWLASLVGLSFLLISEARSSDLIIHGRIHDPQGRPRAAAQASLVPVVSRLEQGELERQGRAEPDPPLSDATDEAGFFRLTAPESGMWKVVVREAGFVPVELPLLPLVEPVTLPPLHLQEDVGITVRLIGSNGRPLVNGRVRAEAAESRRSPRFPQPDWQPAPRLAVTNDHGTAVLPRGAGESLRLLALAPGHLENVTVGVRRPRITLRLRPGRKRSLEVLDHRGAPQPGVMAWTGAGAWPQGITDQRGQLPVCLATTSSMPLELLTVAAAHLRTTLPPVGEEEKPITVRLPAPGAVSGTVLDRRQQVPVTGAFVWARGDPGSFRRTDSTGAYDLPAVAATETWIHTAAPGYFRDAVRVATSPASEGTRAPTLALYPKTFVSGRVLDPQGTALAGVEIRTHFDPARQRFLQLSLSGGLSYSSATGRFRIGNLLMEVPYEALFLKTGFAPLKVSLPALTTDQPPVELRVVMHPGSTAVGGVRSADHEPVAGAQARLLPEPPADLHRRLAQLGDPTRSQTFQAFTGPDGRFEVLNLAAGRYTLEVQAAGFATASVPGLEVLPGAPTVDLGTVVLEPGVAVAGRVLNRRNEPVEGVEIRILPGDELARMVTGLEPDLIAPAALTGPDGWFFLADRRTGERLELSFRRAGYTTLAATVEVPTAEPMVVVMRATSRVAGRVVDADGQPIRHATVSLDAPQEQNAAGLTMVMEGVKTQETTTNQEGRFELSGVEPGLVHLVATAPGHQETIFRGLEVPAGRDIEALELVLVPGVMVEGRVLSPEQLPVVGAKVTLIARGSLPDPYSQGRRQVVTDGEGSYRFVDAAPGPQSLIAEHDRYGRVVRDLEAGAGVNTLDLQFEPAFAVSGRVVDDYGEVVGNARVELRSEPASWQNRTALTAADGGFRFAGLRHGSYLLRVFQAGFAGSHKSVLVDDRDVIDLEVRLGKGATITGRLIGLDLDALSVVELALESLPAEGEVSYDGSYRIRHVAAGERTVSAHLPGVGRRAQGQVLIEPGVPEVNLDLVFDQGWTLTGQILANGEPVVGARVAVLGMGVASSGTAQTDQQGEFRLAGLESGRYRFDLAARSGLQHREEIEITADRDLRIDLAPSEVSGLVVIAAESTPVAGATVSLVPAGGGRPAAFAVETTTDSRGFFRFLAVAAGSWRVVAKRAGFAPGATEITVQAGADADQLRLELQPTSGLILDVVLASGLVPDSIVAVVADASGRTVAAGRYTTGEGGRIHLSTVPEGGWQLLVSARGAGTSERNVVVPGEPVAVRLPATGTLDLVVPELEAGDTPAVVNLFTTSGRPYRALTTDVRIVSDWVAQRGRARVEGLPVGDWLINVTARDGRSWRLRAYVNEGGLTNAELR